MSSVGNDNPQDEGTPRSFWLFIIVLGVGVLVAFVFGVQLLTILLGVVFPPMPPLVDNTTQMSYTQETYGVDEWLYHVAKPGCEVANFYAQKGGSCTLSVDCSATSNLITGSNVAQCVGTVSFSQFIMRWRAVIGVDETDPYQTLLRVRRDVFWGGEIPPDANDFFSTTATPVTP